MTSISRALRDGLDISICFECANGNGGQWPIVGTDKNGNSVNHAATCWVGECGVCGKEASCCSLSDWNWPGHKVNLEREL